MKIRNLVIAGGAIAMISTGPAVMVMTAAAPATQAGGVEQLHQAGGVEQLGVNGASQAAASAAQDPDIYYHA